MPILQGFQRSFPKEENRGIEVKNYPSAYKNISLLDRLTYCEPPLFGGE